MAEYTCPHCKNPIYDADALLCHFCGNSLNRGGGGLLGSFKYGKLRVVWVIVVLLMALSFILLFIRF